MRNKKKAAGVTAGVLAAAILFTGTFAWRSISQTAKNEIIRSVNPGGRLHDDFDGESKDVYVENFMSKAEGGQPIFARVRLDEYMETGPEAGQNPDAADRTATPLVAGTKINDLSTWVPHIPADHDPKGEGGSNKFHEFWEWTMGGETTFMPTFNKNKDSLSADINGTWEGKVKGDFDHFDDFVDYTKVTELTADAYYDMDDDDHDEYLDDPTKYLPGAGGEEGKNYRKSEETHTAKKTGNATVMTMTDWIANDCPMGPIWVYDSDGWAYWAQAIEPGEATGLLLDGIEYVKGDESTCYYGINVVAQFATKDECAVPADAAEGSSTDPCDYIFDEAGAAENAPSANAKRLLKQAMGIGYGVTVTKSAEDVAPKGSVNFTAAVKIGSDELKGDAAKVTWSVSGNKSADTKIDADGKLTVGEDETAEKLTVRATAWNREVGELEITVTGTTPVVPAPGGEEGGTSDIGEPAPEVMTDPAEEEPGVGEPAVGEPVMDEPVVTAPESGLAPEPAAE